MGVLYGYDGSQPKYNIRVHWDANSDLNFVNYEMAYRISGGTWVTESTRAVQIYSWPGHYLYSYNSAGSAMLYKKQFNPGATYEFAVRSWYKSATPVEDEDGYLSYPENVYSDWTTTSVSLPATPGNLTTAARLKGISHTYRAYRYQNTYKSSIIYNADTYDTVLSVLPVNDRFARSTNYQYREYRSPDQTQLGWTSVTPENQICLPDFTCLLFRNLSPSKTYEFRTQTWFNSSTLVDEGDGGWNYQENTTVPEWVTTMVTTPAAPVAGGAPSNFSKEDSPISIPDVDGGEYPGKVYNLSWLTPSTTTNSYGTLIQYDIQTASSTQTYEIATMPSGVTTLSVPPSNSTSVGNFDETDTRTFRIRAVYGIEDGDGYWTVKGYSPWVY
jgi:hypothetical protein